MKRDSFLSLMKEQIKNTSIAMALLDAQRGMPALLFGIS